jgi:hypothetical protein
MKKSVVNVVFYLVCFIVLLLFSAIFFNWKSLEGFREGVDAITPTVDGNATATGNSVALNTTGSTMFGTSSNTATVAASTSVSSVAPVSTALPVTPMTVSSAVPVSDTSNTVAINTSTAGVQTGTLCNAVIGDDKANIYLKPMERNAYPLVNTITPDTCTLAHFDLNNGQQINAIGKDRKLNPVFFLPTTAIVNGIAYGTICSKDHHRTKEKLPITYSESDKTMKVKTADGSSFNIVFMKMGQTSYTASMQAVDPNRPTPNMIRTICQTLK